MIEVWIVSWADSCTIDSQLFTNEKEAKERYNSLSISNYYITNILKQRIILEEKYNGKQITS